MLQDKQVKCKDCPATFTFTARDQEYYASQGFDNPTRCKKCRIAKKKRFENQNRGR